VLKNYFLIAYRNLIKYISFTSVNIIGLAVGFAVCLLLGSYVLTEYSVNHDLRNSGQQYIIESEWKEAGLGVPMTTYAPLARELREQYPQLVADYYRFHAASAVVSAGDEGFRENVQIGDFGFHQMYGFELLYGNPDKAGQAPDGAIISEQAAIKYFGTADALNERIRVETSAGGAYKDYRVTGVLKKTSFNSVINILGEPYNIYLPAEDAARFNAIMTDWESIYIVSMLELQPGVTPDDLKSPIQQLLDTHAPEAYRGKMTPKLTLLRDYYLSQNQALARLLVTLSLIGAFVLFMALANFLGSQIGLASHRLKEVGIRKVLGGHTRQITQQFFAESLLQTGLAMLLALTFYQATQAAFEQFIHREIPGLTEISALSWALIVILLLSVSLLAAVYPVSAASWIPLTSALKNNLQSAGKLYRRGLAPRKVLAAVQFSLAVFILLCTLVVSSQVSYFFDADLGYDKEHLIVLTLPRDWSEEGYQRIATFREQTKALGGIEDATVSFEIPNRNFGSRFNFRGSNTPDELEIGMPLFKTDEHYFDTYGVPLISGRNMNPEREALEVVINEAAAKAFGWENPIGEQVWIDPEFKYEVVGVVKDFHIGKLSDVIEPVVFIHPSNFSNTYRYLTVDLASGPMKTNIEQIKVLWQDRFGAFPFVYEFMDDKLAQIYQAELQLRQATYIATFVVLFIMVLGIINMTALNISFRTKEIGIRKVLGANLMQLYRRFISDYLRITAIALLMATPLAYWLLQNWLENFVYRPEIQWWMWLLPSCIILGLIAILVVLQTTKTCLRNPANTLRYE
jgi:putative ABC transport system permease protein